MVAGHEHAQERRDSGRAARACLHLAGRLGAASGLIGRSRKPAIDAELETWLLEHIDTDGEIIGRGYQAVVRRIETPAGTLVVKSPHPNPILALPGLRAIRREARIYDRLGGIAGIPRSFGLAAGRHLALEHIPGRTLRGVDLTDRERFFSLLLETIRAMHAAGVAHGDLKRKENLIVAADERPWIIDFGIACLGGRAARGLGKLRFELTRQIDLNAWIKRKYGPDPEQIAEEDLPLYRPVLIERLARRARAPWQFLTFRRARKRRRARQEETRQR